MADDIMVHQLADGRFFITDTTVCEVPELLGIIERMGNYWTRHEGNLNGWVAPAPEADHG